MKTLLLKSNHGNHSGFNVKWELLGVFNSLKEGKKGLIDASFDLSDEHVLRHNRAFDIDNKKYICTNTDKSFSYDGRKYMLVTKDDIDLFNGGTYGYLPNEVRDHLLDGQ